MSDSLRHECGIALVRLTKDLKWYQEKYGTPLFVIDEDDFVMHESPGITIDLDSGLLQGLQIGPGGILDQRIVSLIRNQDADIRPTQRCQLEGADELFIRHKVGAGNPQPRLRHVDGEILVEIVATTIGDGFREAQSLVGPYPSGAPAIFIDQCGRIGGSAAEASEWTSNSAVGAKASHG